MTLTVLSYVVGCQSWACMLLLARALLEKLTPPREGWPLTLVLADACLISAIGLLVGTWVVLIARAL